MNRRASGVQLRDSFLQNASVLVGGSAIAQGAALLFSPILSRLYTPEHFGVLAVYSSVLATLAIISTLRYEVAIPLPLPDEEDLAGSLLVLSGLSTFAVGLITLVSVALFRTNIAGLLNAPHIASYLWALPLSVVALGMYQTLQYWAIRQMNFRAIARTRLTQGLGSVLLQAALGAIHPSPLGLIAGQVVGQAAGIDTLTRRTIPSTRWLIAYLRPSHVLAAAVRYRRFPLLTSIPTIINTLTVQLPSILIASYYGVTIAGLFLLSQRVLSSPISIVSDSVRQVFYGRAAQLSQSDPARLRSEFFRLGSRLAVISLLPFALLGFVAPAVFHVLFGKEWAEAGTLLQSLIPMTYLQFVVSPIASLNAIDRQDLYLLWNTLRLVLSLGSLLLAAVMGASPALALGAYAGGMGVAYLILGALWLRAIQT